jgi:methylated-DNA-protein-cysteine methyltransferase-like protein
MSTPSFYDQVYAVVRRIPRGRVTSYGRIAQMLGRPNAARAVGYALNALKGEDDPRRVDIPWQRVVNSQGRISLPNTDGGADRQATLLRAEGVTVDDALRIPLDQYLWEGLHWVELDDILHGRVTV